MTKDEKLAELHERRERFTVFRDLVDEELRQERIQRLAHETASIRTLVLEAAAQGATLGELKRAYNTKDHRTIKDIVTGGALEIEAIRQAASAVQVEPERWFWLDGDHEQDWLTITVDGDTADFEWWEQEDGKFVFNSTTLLWNHDWTVKNKAVEALDGKIEGQDRRATEIAQYYRANFPQA
jgi:hypothetical protein